ncbi:hypothetical protein [Phascolarctobacterium faecium]|uniref:hypothetical protein n=1 Tax=Phascolarctobacterium faecium TaxID=33025 RepID=UPI003521FEB5
MASLWRLNVHCWLGGGLGLAPLLYLAEGFCAQNKPIEILMGGRSEEELFWTDLYEDICQIIHITTDDGSCGVQGTVIALLPQLLDSGKYDCVYVCGPVPMMKAVAEVAAEKNIKCQVSFGKVYGLRSWRLLVLFVQWYRQAA